MTAVIPSIILILQYLQTAAIKKEMKEKLQEIIDKLSALVPEIPGLPGITIIKPLLNNRYHIFSFVTNPTTAWANHALGLKAILEQNNIEHATYMMVIALGGGFTYKINSSGNSLATAVVGDEWSAFEIEEIFVTTPNVAGTALVHVEFRVD